MRRFAPLAVPFALLACSQTVDDVATDADLIPDSTLDVGDSTTSDTNGDTTSSTDTARVDTGFDATPPPVPGAPELWYWHHSYLSGTAPGEPDKSKARIDQALAAGYTGLAFWDSSETFVNNAGWDATKLKAVVDYAKSKGMKVLPQTAPFGYSNDMLRVDPNLAEGQRVFGTQFKVVGGPGGHLELVNSLAPVVNGDFEAGTTGWFGIGDPRVVRDTTQKHGGGASAAIQGSATASDNARLNQKISVKPFRLYHLRFWLKTQDLARGKPTVNILDVDAKPGTAISRFYLDLSVASTQDWTQLDFTFDSNASTSIAIYLGIWGGNGGTVWIDDISVEETALINVLRRNGTPLKLYDASKTYVEGTDFDKIVDPALAASPGHYDGWHAPPTITLPATTTLKADQIVSLDHYTVVPVYGDQVGVCLSEPAVQDWLLANVKALDPIFPKDSGLFLQYDEMRHMHACDLCRKKAATAGDLLAANVGDTIATIAKVRPGAQLYFWNDMFDPHHNAVDDYFYVEQTIAGSWAGLPNDAIIMNWRRTPDSLTWFSGKDPKQPRPFRQILSGYYDSGDGKKSGEDDLAAAKGIPGIQGAMYTAWTDDYSQLAQYAKAIKDGWATYKASVK